MQFRRLDPVSIPIFYPYPVQFILFCLDFSLIISLSVHTEALVYQQAQVRGSDKELLTRGETLILRTPNVNSDPSLGKEPDKPDPGVPVGVEVLEEVSPRAVPVEVVGETSLEDTGVAVPQPTGSDEEGHDDRGGEDHWESKAEPLDADLAGKLAGVVGKAGGGDLDEEHDEGGEVPAGHPHHLLHLATTWKFR